MKRFSFIYSFKTRCATTDFTDGKTSRMPGKGLSTAEVMAQAFLLKALRKIARDYSNHLADVYGNGFRNAVERWACSYEDNTRDRELRRDVLALCKTTAEENAEKVKADARAGVDELEKIMNGKD